MPKPKTNSNHAQAISAHVRAHANDFAGFPPWAAAWLAKHATLRTLRRVQCGARRRYDGKPCRAKSVPGKRRCRWHGGCSTGPKSQEGKARLAANLRSAAGHVSDGDS